MRIKDIEFRHMNNRTAEVVRWASDSSGNEYCYTLLFYQRSSEGYEVEFVGARPFEYADEELLWVLMKYGQTVMDAKWRVEAKIK